MAPAVVCGGGKGVVPAPPPPCVQRLVRAPHPPPPAVATGGLRALEGPVSCTTTGEGRSNDGANPSTTKALSVHLPSLVCENTADAVSPRKQLCPRQPALVIRSTPDRSHRAVTSSTYVYILLAWAN